MYYDFLKMKKKIVKSPKNVLKMKYVNKYILGNKQRNRNVKKNIMALSEA